MPNLFEPKPITWPGEEKLRGDLLGYINKYKDANKNMENLTPYESQALEFLQQYLDNDQIAPTITAGESEVMKTLMGDYDPESSAYYKPLISGIEQKKQQAISKSNRASQLGGNLTSLSRLRAGNELETSYDAETANLLMGLQERERGRRLEVLNPALQYGQYVNEGPLRKAEAARTVGSIPRDLETGAINLGSGILTNYRPTYYMDPTDEYLKMLSGKGGSGWGRALGSIAGGVGGAMIGGPTGGALGASLGGYFGGKIG